MSDWAEDIELEIDKCKLKIEELADHLLNPADRVALFEFHGCVRLSLTLPRLNLHFALFNFHFAI